MDLSLLKESHNPRITEKFRDLPWSTDIFYDENAEKILAHNFTDPRIKTSEGLCRSRYTSGVPSLTPEDA
ncbi:hypothetical protein DXG01_011474 [Tephrocybe rancida]|nr:hypothetical protein DXG01_013787 [Tephrocybe rancida]KAG6904183.1 hypothetical protein DXG01_012008 [Tephrocybe rancida]KAG6904225.1 hypothetical protein DXG01_011626 [Tephrocybe rancida]KAG6912866.1 hypothetical protein DXG01_011474 [Tephrocybe rancida]